MKGVKEIIRRYCWLVVLRRFLCDMNTTVVVLQYHAAKMCGRGDTAVRGFRRGIRSESEAALGVRGA